MNVTEFKRRLSKLIDITIEAELRRFEKISNKKLEIAGISVKRIVTDKDVTDAWNVFNKNQADWEAYCRRPKPVLNNNYVDYSHLAYNGVTEDF